MKEALVFGILVLLAWLVAYFLFKFLRFPEFFFKILFICTVVLIAFSSLMFITGIYTELPVLNGLFEQIKSFIYWIMQKMAASNP